MKLGKRARPPMKRTTSMTEFTLDLNQPSNAAAGLDQRSPSLHRRNSADMGETAHFLRFCSLCNRRLIPGRDIYMYRGDTAFCSLECRHQQMKQDEKKEKCSFSSNKEATTATAAA